MSGVQVKEFLSEVLKVRHSFAHGFELPGFTWTITPSGRKQLSDSSLERVQYFFRHLAVQTDHGLRNHAAMLFSGLQIW